MEEILKITVYGQSRPQGSKSAGIGKNTGKAFTYEANPRTMPWRGDLKQVLGKEWMTRERLDEAVVIDVDFYLNRPKSRKGEIWVKSTPDIDKLERAVLDALQETALVNDSRVCILYARKVWSVHPRVTITIGRPDESDLEGLELDAEEVHGA